MLLIQMVLEECELQSTIATDEFALFLRDGSLM